MGQLPNSHLGACPKSCLPEAIRRREEGVTGCDVW
jgi:hypothetical protein